MIVGGVLMLIFVMAGAALLWFVAGRTGGIGRFFVAALMALGIAWFGIGYFRQVADPPPPEPEPATVDPSLRLAYLCEMCGLELAVVKVAKDRAPKHCGESMVLVRN